MAISKTLIISERWPTVWQEEHLYNEITASDVSEVHGLAEN